MENKIFIYGVPGSGKTYFSKLLEARLNWPLFEVDTIRHKMQNGKTKEDNPFLFAGTSQAYKYFGELNSENVARGLKAVRDALRDEISLEVEKCDKLIVEGAFLDPNVFTDRGRVILIVTKDESRHKDRFFQHRPEDKDKLDEFRAARLIQDYLIDEARKLDVDVIENNHDIESRINLLISKI